MGKDLEALRVPYGMAVHDEQEENAVLEIIRNHKTIMGEKVKQFEQEIATLFSKDQGIMVNSGSSANLLTFEVLDIPENSEVITPILTFATTLSPIIKKGLIPVFVDVEPETYVVDIDQVEQSITSKTKALMIPSLLGNIPDLKRLRKITDENNLIFVEDSADTLGATFDGIPTGKFSDVSTTSFYGSHIITAAGEGGMICCNNKKWDEKFKILKQIKKGEIPESYKETMIEINKGWGDQLYWRSMAQMLEPRTAIYYWNAVDRTYDIEKNVVMQEENRRMYMKTWWKTLKVSIYVTVYCLILGFPVAHLLANLPLRYSNLLMIFVLLPFWTSLLVRTTAWIVMLQQNGVINGVLVWLGILSDDGRIQMVYNMTGTIIAMTQILLPFMILPLYSVMKVIPKSHMRAAMNLGAKPSKAFIKVYLMSVPSL